ncbi:hypothetical protein M1N48_00580 [Dehalococcoidia bacterium]|nr:hypothetical protein [Dehalococcoidia bacterium]
MKLLIVLFISSLLVLSIGCGNGQELRKEIELLREEVNLLKCHAHVYGNFMGEGPTELPIQPEWTGYGSHEETFNLSYGENLCPPMSK